MYTNTTPQNQDIDYFWDFGGICRGLQLLAMVHFLRCVVNALVFIIFL